MKMTQYELGKNCLVILRLKTAKKGMTVDQSLTNQITKFATLIQASCREVSRDDLADFYEKYLIPAAQMGALGRWHSCADEVAPTEKEAYIAYRLLKFQHFWGLDGLRDHVKSLADKCPLSFEVIASIAVHIANKHLRDQFGDIDTKHPLEVTGEAPDQDGVNLAEIR